MKSRLVITLAAMFGVLSGVPACASEEAFVIPAPEVDNPKAAGSEQTAVLAGGCFWGVQGVFQHLNGVKRVLSGYAGGEKRTAHYEVVSGGDTGHAESVEIVFDPKQVSYGEILQVFFSVAHDPTQLNRQGSRLRNAVSFLDLLCRRAAEEDRDGLHRATRQDEGVSQNDRHAAWTR